MWAMRNAMSRPAAQQECIRWWRPLDIWARRIGPRPGRRMAWCRSRVKFSTGWIELHYSEWPGAREYIAAIMSPSFLLPILVGLGALLVGIALGFFVAQLGEARRARQLRATFDSLASSSLRANNETFLALAREHLGRHQQVATATLTEREKAIETMLSPIREALNKTEQQISRIEKERAEAFGS